MPHYIVTRKVDSVEVTRYSASAPTEAVGYPFATHDHTEWNPDDPAPPPSSIKITKFAFRDRFTSSEKVTIELASLDVPTGSLDARAAAAQVRVWVDDIAAAQYVDLALQATRDGVIALENYGLLPAGRALVILDTPPAADEVFNG